MTLRGANRYLAAGLLWLAGCASPAVADATHRAQIGPKAPLAVPLRVLEPAEDYKLGPRDVVTIRIRDLYQAEEVAEIEAEVESSGKIEVPLVGPVAAAGATVTGLRQAIVRGLAGHIIVNPQVVVTVKEYRSRRIVVIGAVSKPGIHFLNQNRLTLVDALSLAGGLSKEAGTRAIVSADVAAGVTGTAAARSEVDLVALLVRGDPRANLVLEPGSVVQVLPAEDFYVAGYVNKPGAFLYQRPLTLMQAIGMAGGLNAWKASPSAVSIKRAGSREMQVIEVNVDEIARGAAPDPPIRAGDIVQADRTLGRALFTEFVDFLNGRIGVGYQVGTATVGVR